MTEIVKKLIYLWAVGTSAANCVTAPKFESINDHEIN